VLRYIQEIITRCDYITRSITIIKQKKKQNDKISCFFFKERNTHSYLTNHSRVITGTAQTPNNCQGEKKCQKSKMRGGETDSTEMKTTTWFITHAPTLTFHYKFLYFRLTREGQTQVNERWTGELVKNNIKLKKIMGVNF